MPTPRPRSSRRGLFAFLVAGVAALALGGPWSQAMAAEPPVKALASFSILGDMVREVGGARVRVITLVGPNGDAHVYQARPADARAVAEADIVFVNGLGFEGWIDRLIAAAGFRGPLVVASDGVAPRALARDQDHEGHRQGGAGDGRAFDPHAWQNLANARIYVANIAQGLSAVDPAGATEYRANAARYQARIDALDQEVRQALARVPPARRKVVTSHDAFGYFAAAYGIAMVAPEGTGTESQASAAGVGRLIRQIKAENIPAVFVENIADPRLIAQIRRETGAAIGGTLYSDALSPPDGPAATYLQMFRHNLATLLAALAP